MKKLLYLINFELSQMIKKLLVLYGCMVIAQMVFFYIATSNFTNKYLRFEDVINTSGYAVIFFVVGGVILILSGFSFYQNYFGSKSIYTLMMLPSKRSYIFVSKYISSVISLLVLVAVQLLIIFLSYGLYVMKFSDIPKVNNGLFLAFIRSGFIRVIFPFDLFSLIISLVSLLSLAALVIYLVVCERSKNFIRMIVLPIILLRALMLMFPVYQNEMLFSVKVGAVIIGCMIYMVYYLIKAINQANII